MKRLLVVLVFALASFLSLGNVAVAQQAMEFQLGFKALADQLPADVVGAPVENEYFNLSNGNSEQHTTMGLMVWRKIDNWTAYTNGYMSWINGPAGMQSRMNTARFDWEGDPPTPSTMMPAPSTMMPPSNTNPPAGATAQCKDGTYSFSASRSGTCSSHGGVAKWLN